VCFAGKESELRLVSQKLLTHKSHAQRPHGTYKALETAKASVFRAALCSNKSFLNIKSTKGCSQVLGPVAWTATGDGKEAFHRSLALFLSLVCVVLG